MKALKAMGIMFLVVVAWYVFESGSLSVAEENQQLQQGAMKIDGNFDDWQNVQIAKEDAIGDVDPEDSIDFAKVWVVAENENIYISYQCAKPMDWNTEAWKYNIFIDADNDCNTGYRGWEQDWALGADYLLQGATIFKFSGKDRMTWGWTEVGLQLYAIAENRVELQVPRSIIEIEKEQPVRILLHGDNYKKVDFLPDSYAVEVITIE